MKRSNPEKAAAVILAALLILGIIITAAGITQKMPAVLKEPVSAKWEDADSATEGETVTKTVPADGTLYTEQKDGSIKEASSGSQSEKIAFKPACTEDTKPSALISTTQINVNGTTLSDESSYQPWYKMDFGTGAEYTSVDGIVTFRGNNFRNDPTFGTASIKKNTIEDLWTVQTGTLSGADGAYWSGSGWTGQPLMEKWPRDVKEHMNMYDWAKEKDSLVEVIYACMDGHIYFLDKDTGEATRPAMNVGWTFKGAGALDPRGYPILYVGAGYDSANGTARVFVISLLDESILYEFGADDPFSLRGHLSFFDSSPLVDADSDTLIYPGENGILYLIRLGTQYDRKNGTLTISPDNIVKWRYWGTRSSAQSFWIGMEDSCAVYGGYLFVSDNGGNLMCLDLNTLQLVWCQDTLDDSNSSPVLSIEDGHLYLYTTTSFRLGWRSSTTATVPIWKIDAENGEIVWEKDYECYSVDGVSGGCESTIALGREGLGDYIYATVARTGDIGDGVCACLSKKTGKVIWEHKAAYAWSSPVCVYNKDGTGKVIYASSNGRMYLLDGTTGEQLDAFKLSDQVIEASPAVYDSTVVIGTRDCHIWGLELK